MTVRKAGPGVERGRGITSGVLNGGSREWKVVVECIE